VGKFRAAVSRMARLRISYRPVAKRPNSCDGSLDVAMHVEEIVGVHVFVVLPRADAQGRVPFCGQAASERPKWERGEITAAPWRGTLVASASWPTLSGASMLSLRRHGWPARLQVPLAGRSKGF
jgi:hypothetical protein